MRNIEQLYLNFNKTLFDEICSIERLTDAFREVKRNKGAAGVDGVEISIYAQNLSEELGQLKHEVENWTYKPQPVKLVEIAKPGGGVRRLGIPIVKDRVLQTAIKNVLEPIIDPEFSENSYGFRPGKSQKQALEAAYRIVKRGKEYVVDMDLSRFFDRINHDRLIERLKNHINDTRVLRLIGITLRCGVEENGKFRSTPCGSIQGSPLSPLLSNVVLDELDKELEKRGLEFCRFADDCNIFVRSEKAANRVRISITNFIEKKLKLIVNQEKTTVAKSKYVQFLGMTILTVGLSISNKSMAKAMDKVKSLTPRGTNLSVEKTIERFNLWYRGWANYYEMTSFPSQLVKIEAHARRRIRAQFLRDQKRKRYLYRKLVKRGVSKAIAAKYVYSNKKTWNMSACSAVHRAWPNQYFRDIGMYTHSDKRKLHWKKLKIYPALT